MHFRFLILESTWSFTGWRLHIEHNKEGPQLAVSQSQGSEIFRRALIGYCFWRRFWKIYDRNQVKNELKCTKIFNLCKSTQFFHKNAVKLFEIYLCDLKTKLKVRFWGKIPFLKNLSAVKIVSRFPRLRNKQIAKISEFFRIFWNRNSNFILRSSNTACFYRLAILKLTTKLQEKLCGKIVKLVQ